MLAACAGGPASSATPAPSASEPSPEPSPPAPPPPPPPPLPDPLTGVLPQPTAPLVALKVDNAPISRSFHTGLGAASVVYVELVEGGITRLVALYSAPYDQEVGPIRSFRESNVELLAQHGPVAVGFSGASTDVLARFRTSVSEGLLNDVSYDVRPELYRIGERRVDAKNFYAVPARLSAAATGAAAARDIGWVFDPAVRPDAVPFPAGRAVMSDEEAVTLRYDPPSGRYAVIMGRRPLIDAAPANVVVQQVEVRAAKPTPLTQTIGSGPVDVLRDGVRVTGTWSRGALGEGTRLVDAAGLPIALTPGPTWVLLQPRGLPFAPG